MGLKIGFTYDLRSDYPDEPGLPDDTFAEMDYEDTVDSIAEAMASGGHEVIKLGGFKKLLKKISSLDVDIVFNICEGIGSRNRESEVPVLLDHFGVPYVGSDGLTLGITLDKATAKRLFLAEGVPTPKFFIGDKDSKCDFSSYKWPLIVKPRHEGTSKGVWDDSVCTTKKVVKEKIARIVDDYGQTALVEEFIAGREFTVLIIGNDQPIAFPSVQIQILNKLDLGGLIYTSERVGNNEVEYVCPAKIPRALEQKLRSTAIAAYKAVGCRDFGRVDFRVDKKNKVFCLEVNPLPSLAVEDIFPPVAESVGITYSELVLKVLDAAFARYGLKESEVRMRSMRQKVLANVG